MSVTSIHILLYIILFQVCRALVMEAMELSFFLEKTYLAQQESEQSEELKLLARKDWVNIHGGFFALCIKC